MAIKFQICFTFEGILEICPIRAERLYLLMLSPQHLASVLHIQIFVVVKLNEGNFAAHVGDIQMTDVAECFPYYILSVPRLLIGFD